MDVPEHIAIVPDGNRRWGQYHGVSKEGAYAIGIRKIGHVAKWCRDAGVKMLTMWGFSTENFERDEKEIGMLFSLFEQNLKEALRRRDGTDDYTRRYDAKVRFLGRINLFPKKIQEMFRKVEEHTKSHETHSLNLLLAYGGRAEIVDAVNTLMKEGKGEVSEEDISSHMYTAGLPDPDLVIRTSGEQRLSGLMPWQTVYSEIYFSGKLWPDFSKADFEEALFFYAKRKRRFGK